MNANSQLDFESLDLCIYAGIEIDESYHSEAKCKDLSSIALAAARELFTILLATKELGTFTYSDGRIYDFSRYGDYSDSPDVIESWLCSFMLSKDLFDEVITSEESRQVLAEEYGIGVGGPFRPTNYVDSEDEDAYENAYFDETSIIAIEDKVILLIGIMAHHLGLDYKPVKEHFEGCSGKLFFYNKNRIFIESIQE